VLGQRLLQTRRAPAARAALVILAIVWLILSWSRKKSAMITTFVPRPMLLLITGPDGYLSLWRTQLTIWTLAVGSLVLLFGMLQLNVPEIPETLVALMGMSLLTGLSAKRGQATSPTPAVAAAQSVGAGAAAATEQALATAEAAAAVKTAAAVQAATGTPVIANPEPILSAPVLVPSVAQPAAVPTSPDWVDLISTWNETTKQVELSIPKAQMVFWTVIIVALFCGKSVLGGELWSVPWAMVALTGFSQAGYIGDKFVKGRL
jgi:hypothetical protein